MVVILSRARFLKAPGAERLNIRNDWNVLNGAERWNDWNVLLLDVASRLVAAWEPCDPSCYDDRSDAGGFAVIEVQILMIAIVVLAIIV